MIWTSLDPKTFPSWLSLVGDFVFKKKNLLSHWPSLFFFGVWVRFFRISLVDEFFQKKTFIFLSIPGWWVFFFKKKSPTFFTVSSWWFLLSKKIPYLLHRLCSGWWLFFQKKNPLSSRLPPGWRVFSKKILYLLGHPRQIVFFSKKQNSIIFSSVPDWWVFSK